MFKIKVGYPKLDDEVEIALSTTSSATVELKPVISKTNILKIQQIVRHVIVSKSVAHYAVRLVRATRPQETDREYVKHYLTWGAGPRACQALLLGAKARALLDGRPHVSLDDVRTLAKPVLRHRIVTSFAAESENINSDDVVDQIVGDLPEMV
jgi:MoxR-like ATPase